MTKKPAKTSGKKMGRPSGCTPEVTEEICMRLSTGESLVGICKDDHMPALGTVMGWFNGQHEEFSERYARAQAARSEYLMAELEAIADTPCKDSTEAQHRRLQVDTRKWIISKLYPRKYGDRVEQILSGDVKVETITRTVIDPKIIDGSKLITERNIANEQQ